jgi:glycine C-acetyltransferase
MGTSSGKKLSPAFANRFRATDLLIQYGKAQGLYFYMRQLESGANAHVTVEGRPMLMFSSNNYLGMANHPKVKEAAIRAIRKYGTGACSARLMGGTFRLHEELEERLADWEGQEAAVIYSSGYVSNVATLSTLLAKDDMVFVDEQVHASLVDGLRFAQIPFRAFAHNDPADLKKKLTAYNGSGQKTIIVDGVYSMEGDIAKLPEVHALAKRHGALLILDEAHGSGVLGASGRGTAEHFGLHGKIDVVVGTLSKALGGVGGFAAGPRVMIDYLKHNARGFVFSAAMPPAICASIMAALDVIETEPQWLSQLHVNARQLREGLQKQGWDTGLSESPIIPVILGDDMKTYEMTRALFEQGIYVSPITYPGVKKGAARLRMSVMATHSSDDISRALEAFEKFRKHVFPSRALPTRAPSLVGARK